MIPESNGHSWWVFLLSTVYRLTAFTEHDGTSTSRGGTGEGRTAGFAMILTSRFPGVAVDEFDAETDVQRA